MQLRIAQPQQSSEAIAIVSSGKKSQQAMAQLRHLLAEAQDNYPELAQINFLPVPLPKHSFELENWNYWLAAQTIAQWRELPLEYSSVGEIVAQLGLVKSEKTWSVLDALQQTNLQQTNDDSTLSLEILKQVDRIRHQHNYHQLLPLGRHKSLEREVAILSNWFIHPQQDAIGDAQSCMSRLHANRQAIGLRQRHRLKEFVDSWQQIGPRSVLRALQTLTMTLSSLMTDYETYRQQCIDKENAAYRSYRQLRSKLLECQRSFGRRQADWETIWQAIAKYYQFKLEAEIYTQASQLLEELKHQVETYATAATHSDELLAGMQQWFSDRCPTEPFAAPLLRKHLAERVDSLNLRQEMEQLVACPLHQWGSLDLVKHQMLLQTIFTRLQPLCWEVYAECHQYFMHFDTLAAPAQPNKSEVMTEIVSVKNSCTLQIPNAETHKLDQM